MGRACQLIIIYIFYSFVVTTGYIVYCALDGSAPPLTDYYASDLPALLFCPYLVVCGKVHVRNTKNMPVDDSK
jgi:hypothetical protein